MVAYSLITPDGVVDGRVPDVVRLLDAGGVGVRSLHYVAVDAARMLRLYGGSSYVIHAEGRPPQPVANSLIDRIFDRAPGVFIDIEDQPRIYETLLRVKGHTDPFEASSDTVRQGGRDALFNSLHCPDDAASAESERAVLAPSATPAFNEAAIREFCELDELAVHCSSLNVETTVLRTLLRLRANSIGLDSTPLFDAPLLSTDGVAEVRSLAETLCVSGSARSRREAFRQWAGSHLPSDDIVWILEHLDPGGNAGAISTHDRDLLEVGLMIERGRG